MHVLDCVTLCSKEFKKINLK